MKDDLSECPSVTTINIPPTLKTFYPGKFSIDKNQHYDKFVSYYEEDHNSFPTQLPNLRYFNVHNDNPNFTTVRNQLLVSKDKTILYCCPPGQNDPTAAIFTGIKHFGSYAFNGCKLQKLIIPTSLESVDDNTFSGFSSLVEFANATNNPDTKYQVYNGILFEFRQDLNKKYTKPSMLVSYPDAKKVEGGYTIWTNDTYGAPSSIAPFAFDDVVIKNVIMPKTVSETTIGRCAFLNSTIYNFSTSNPIYEIQEFAFTDANSFYSFACDNVTFGSGVSTMKVMPYSFWNSNITLFSFPKRKWTGDTPQLYIDINDYAFYYSKNLASITIPPLTNEGGCVVRRLGKWCFAGCTGMASFDFRKRTLSDNQVIGVPEGAFANCKNLQSIYFDDNVVDSVGDFAFYGDQLAYWCFANQNQSIKSIGKYAFAKDIKYKENSNNFHGDQFNLNNFCKLEKIGEGAFSFCNIDKTLSFYKRDENPQKGHTLIKKIEPYTFAGNTFENVNLGIGIEEIGSGAFIDNPNLTKITLPSSLKKIIWNDKKIRKGNFYYYGASIGNQKLRYIIIAESNKQYGVNTLQSILYDKTTKELIHCAENYGFNAIGGGKTRKGLIIEDEVPGIKSIGKWAFGYNQNFEGIVLPSTLKSIDEAAFGYAQKLQSLTIPATVTTIGLEPFYGCESIKDVYFMPSTPPTITGQDGGATFIHGNEGQRQRGVNIYFKKTSEDKYLAAKGIINPFTTGDYTYKIPIPKEYQVKQKKFSICRDFDVNCNNTNFAVYAINKYSKPNEVPGQTMKRYVPSRIGTNHDIYVGAIMQMWRDKNDEGYIEDGNYYCIGEHDYQHEGFSSQNLQEEYIGVDGTNNWLVGCPVPTYVGLINAPQKYALKNNKFAIYTQEGFVPANKAYLDLTDHPYASTSASAKEINITFEEEDNSVTDIDSPIVDINETSSKDHAVYYTLSGMKVEHPTKGIYIRNGKKVVIK